MPMPQATSQPSSLRRTAAPLSRAVISSWLDVGVQPEVAMNKEGRHAQLSKTPRAPAEICPSAFSSRPSTRQAPPPPPSQWRHVGDANVTTMHVVISLPSSCWQNQRSISQKNISVGQQIAAPPLLDEQRPASHLRDHLISFIVDIFQYGRANTKAESATWIRNLAPHY